MPTLMHSRTAALLSGALLYAAQACVAPHALAQQYAVPAGEAIVLDGGAGAVYGQPVSSGSMSGGMTGGVHADPQMHTAYRSVSGGGEIVAESYPQVRSTEYPRVASAAGYGGEQYVFDEPGYAGPVVADSVYGGEYGGNLGPGGYGEMLCDDGCCDTYGGGYGGSYGSSYGCDTGLCDSVCGSCGTVGCTPGTCDPTCEGDLACGGPVVCNKFGRCGKFYTHATATDACGLSAGYGFLFLRPTQGDGTAAILRTATGRTTTSTRQEFDFDLTTGSRIFAELIRPDAIGVRLTYSGLEADSDRMVFDGTPAGVTSAAVPSAFFNPTNAPAGIVTAVNGDLLTARSEVQFSNFDADATRRLRAGHWLLNTGGGLRIARLDQDYSAVVTGANPGQATSETTFHGAGLTGFAEARRPIGNSGFAFLTSARVALMAGENETKSRVSQGGVTSIGSSSRNDFVPVGELQVGGEWSAWLNPTTLFFTQAAYEGHIWGGVGSPGSQNGNVGFTGFNLTMGVEW
ncbi:Lpg1974 family pore-forming outer membrane protein [Alienimonas chondri]|uniref:Uncharacterized protein n=1 Tax=Alienimonas chondri TaxID=2681879 RepID=A0ABX1VJM3_9PLAN|nr:Lpg1974 family pore-forming outer membrane protein [Alienimonas chondri]NNJ27458.1 hypothetical protein [Alienimonas chondri]